jgi:hypothetical protein
MKVKSNLSIVDQELLNPAAHMIPLRLMLLNL